MGLLSLFKQKQETSNDQDSGEFRSQAEDDSRQARARGKNTDAPRKNKPSKANDPVLPEKKRARRRLIGAVALVLAAVVGLPMILDSEPKQLADDISIKIPSRDKPLADGVAPSVAEPVAPRAQPVPEPAEEIIDPVPAGKTTAPAATTPAISPLAKSDPATTVAPSPDKAGKTDMKTVARPEAKAEKQAGAAVVARTSEKDGAPGKSDNKAVTAEQAKSATARTANADDEAARALAILEGKAPPKQAGKPEGAAKSSYVVQVAALATEEKVRELQSKLKAANISSHTQKVATASGGIIRVKVGPFESREEADKMRAKLAKLGLNGNLIAN